MRQRPMRAQTSRLINGSKKGAIVRSRQRSSVWLIVAERFCPARTFLVCALRGLYRHWASLVSRALGHRPGVLPFGYSAGMSRRTYETDGTRATSADDLDELVIDKRQRWRATPAKARRRQRRYGRRLTKELRYSEVL